MILLHPKYTEERNTAIPHEPAQVTADKRKSLSNARNLQNQVQRWFLPQAVVSRQQARKRNNREQQTNEMI